jgi:hypothetical protein
MAEPNNENAEERGRHQENTPYASGGPGEHDPMAEWQREAEALLHKIQDNALPIALAVGGVAAAFLVVRWLTSDRMSPEQRREAAEAARIDRMAAEVVQRVEQGEALRSALRQSLKAYAPREEPGPRKPHWARPILMAALTRGAQYYLARQGQRRGGLEI